MVTHVSLAFCRFCRSTLFRHIRKRCRPKFLPKHRSDSEHKDTSLKMRSKLPTQALPSKFSFHPKNIVRTPLQKMPTYVPKEKNTLKALESTGWSQYSRRTVLALQKYFSKWRCTKPNPKSRPPLLQSRSFLFWESKSKPAQALPMLSKNFQGLWQIASPRQKGVLKCWIRFKISISNAFSSFFYFLHPKQIFKSSALTDTALWNWNESPSFLSDSIISHFRH